MRKISLLGFAVCLITLIGIAPAVVVNQDIVPASVKEKDGLFSVTGERRDDGLIHFTITYRPKEPHYVVATTTIHDGGKVSMQTNSAVIVRHDPATFYVTVPPERVVDTTFEVAERTFVDQDSRAIAVPGGIDYQIKLGEFKPAAGKK